VQLAGRDRERAVELRHPRALHGQAHLDADGPGQESGVRELHGRARLSAARSDGVSMLLRMRDIGRSFPGVRALAGVSLEVEAGEVHAILGENGAGKSTLCNVLSGVFSDYDGRIELDGRRVDIHAPRAAQELGIAMIHQELNLVPDMSIADNIFLGREPR